MKKKKFLLYILILESSGRRVSGPQNFKIARRTLKEFRCQREVIEDDAFTDGKGDRSRTKNSCQTLKARANVSDLHTLRNYFLRFLRAALCAPNKNRCFPNFGFSSVFCSPSTGAPINCRYVFSPIMTLSMNQDLRRFSKASIETLLDAFPLSLF